MRKKENAREKKGEREKKEKRRRKREEGRKYEKTQPTIRSTGLDLIVFFLLSIFKKGEKGRRMLLGGQKKLPKGSQVQ